MALPTLPSKLRAVLGSALATFLKLVVPVLVLAWTQHAAGQTVSISAVWQALTAAGLAAFAVLYHGVPAALSSRNAAKVAKADAKLTDLVSRVQTAIKASDAPTGAVVPPPVV